MSGSYDRRREYTRVIDGAAREPSLETQFQPKVSLSTYELHGITGELQLRIFVRMVYCDVSFPEVLMLFWGGCVPE